MGNYVNIVEVVCKCYTYIFWETCYSSHHAQLEYVKLGIPESLIEWHDGLRPHPQMVGYSLVKVSFWKKSIQTITE
jgi:hypothetical protein